MRHLVCACVFLVVVVSGQRSKSSYTNKYDNVDVDRIIGNDRILTSYIKCMMDEGPCTAEGRELKKTLPDALKTDCGGCNEMQKKTAEKVINHMRTARTKDWDRLQKKYDPTGLYKKHYEELLATSTAVPKVDTPAAAGVAEPKVKASVPAASKVKVAPAPKVKAAPEA